MTIKHIDTYGKKWSVATVGALSFGYLIFILPIHLGFAGFSFAFRETIFNGVRQQEIPLTIFLWSSLALTLALTTYSIIKQRKNLKAFISYFKESEFHTPNAQNIAMNRTGWGSVSLDTKNGTILYINHPDTTILNFFFPKDVRIMGFGMSDWKTVEVEGNTLRIYTGIPELPSVAIVTGKAHMLYEKINAMRNQAWTYENNVPGYVEHQAKRIAEKHGLNLILPPQ